jgi:hypothetical protein
MVAVYGYAGQRLGVQRMQVTAVGVALGLCLWRIALLPNRPLHPRLDLYRQGDEIARSHSERVWFPWHPLITVFSEHRLYHVEDGMYVRFVSGRPLTYAEARRHLPPRMTVIALPRNASDWGIALRLLPPDARTDNVGLWTLHSWSEPPAAAP